VIKTNECLLISVLQRLEYLVYLLWSTHLTFDSILEFSVDKLDVKFAKIFVMHMECLQCSTSPTAMPFQFCDGSPEWQSFFEVQLKRSSSGISVSEEWGMDRSAG
jgi:hypothetical protein